MTAIKICGVTTPEDAAMVAAAGADYIGLNFWDRSKRYLPPERAAEVAAAARAAGKAQLVGVFVEPDPDDVTAVLARVDLDLVQLHGDESPDHVAAIALAAKHPVWKAVAASANADLDGLDAWHVAAVLLDTPSPDRGGTGIAFDWAIAVECQRRYPDRHLVLAGGLTAENVAHAIELVSPWAVDVASGVERAPGLKDAARVRSFIDAVRATQKR